MTNLHTLLKSLKSDAKYLLKNVVETYQYYRLGSQRLAFAPTSVVIVCKGNICRSAFAEFALKRLLYGKCVSVSSFGLDAVDGTPPPPETVRIAKEWGLDLSNHHAKSRHGSQIDSADVVIVMELAQYKRLLELFPQKRKNLFLLKQFAPFPDNLLCNVDDPFGRGEATFRRCFGQIYRALQKFSAFY